MKAIKIREVMTSPVLTLDVETPLSRVAEMMDLHHIRHLPVMEVGRLTGIITKNDLFRLVPTRVREEGHYFDPDELNRFVLRHVMTRDPVTVQPDDLLLHAVGIMMIEKFGVLPVIDGERHVVGIVSQIDILRLLHRVLAH